MERPFLGLHIAAFMEERLEAKLVPEEATSDDDLFASHNLGKQNEKSEESAGH